MQCSEAVSRLFIFAAVDSWFVFCVFVFCVFDVWSFLPLEKETRASTSIRRRRPPLDDDTLYSVEYHKRVGSPHPEHENERRCLAAARIFKKSTTN